MEVKTSKDGGTVTISVKGRLNTTTAPDFDKAVADHMSGSDAVVIDMSELDFISSAGIRSIMKLRMAVGPDRLRIIRASGLVREVFEVSGIAEMLED